MVTRVQKSLRFIQSSVFGFLDLFLRLLRSEMKYATYSFHCFRIISIYSDDLYCFGIKFLYNFNISWFFGFPLRSVESKSESFHFLNFQSTSGFLDSLRNLDKVTFSREWDRTLERKTWIRIVHLDRLANNCLTFEKTTKLTKVDLKEYWKVLTKSEFKLCGKPWNSK